MRRLTRRRLTMRWASFRSAEGDRGAAALVAILLSSGVIMAMAALGIDVGQLYVERRQLQSGADAAALAVAQDAARACTAGTCAPAARAQEYADLNAADGASAVLEVCGVGWAAVPACAGQGTPELTRCAVPSAGANHWVRVRTGTRTPGGATLLPASFARVLAGGAAGRPVFACGQAGWGAPSSITATLPLALSLCEWTNYTANGTSYAPPPPYLTYPLSSERAIYYHDTTGAAHCGAGPSGADLPGGFGWLATGSGTCEAQINDQNWVNASTGNAVPNQCSSAALASMLGTIVYVPVYDNASGLTGSNGSYHVSGFGAFFLTGFSFPGDRRNSIASGTRYCTPSQTCVYGWFTQGLAPTGATGTGVERGTASVQLVG